MSDHDDLWTVDFNRVIAPDGDSYLDAHSLTDSNALARRVAAALNGGHPAETEPTADLWTCEDCAFTFAAEHTNTDGSGWTCPVCEEARLRAERDELRRRLNDACAILRAHAEVCSRAGALQVLEAHADRLDVPAADPASEPCATCGDTGISYRWGKEPCPDCAADPASGDEDGDQ